ncbi:hypothetical protein IWW55_004303 [Coemansia sp. RSA 2706]|nr:hypothetical protein LPJ70_001151 [Coemansia sp. RSA 2708]KAJ2299027.1 hypothetical protein IWW55_004303 [Coemansia sp. RSA 2706]KAJ2718564.1 hypothetical protein H4R23_004996 [Coemansia sp. Cherry 401B]
MELAWRSDSDWQESSLAASSEPDPTPPTTEDSVVSVSSGASSASTSPMRRLTLQLRRSSRRPAQPYSPPPAAATRAGRRSSQRLSQRSRQPRAPNASNASEPRARPTRRRRVGSTSSSNAAATSSIASSLDCEVTIFTAGTSVPQETTTCCICNQPLAGDAAAINAHIDECLRAPLVEYEWAGQTRVRSTALVEGGLVRAGVADACCSKPSDEDVDVDTRDETHYGAPQYSDSDLVLAAPNAHQRRPSDPQFEFVPAEKHEPPEAPEPPEKTEPAEPRSAGGASSLVIEALKARIREQDGLLQRIPRCSVCQDAHHKPCASINCWHVFCEACWMRSLGAKKLCPQCQQITQPSDLRRIYM